MIIYTPYFYIIQNVNTKKYYAGAKWAKDSNPENFMKEDGYQTSSKIIHEIIEEDGLNSFIIRKIKTFETAEDVYNYETRFLERVDAKNNDNFYNRHNNDNYYQISYGSEEFENVMLKHYGVENPMYSGELKEKLRDTNLEKYGVENVFQSEEIKDKIKETNLKKYGVEYTAQSGEVKDKIKNTLLKNYGVENAMYSDKVKLKLEETNLRKYGVKNVAQSEEVKKKIKDKINYLLNRPQLDVIRKYKKEYNLTLEPIWFRKSDEYINKLLEDLIKEYGIIE